MKKFLEKTRKVLNKCLEWVCIFLLIFMVIMASWQIITRYIFKNPSTISESLLTYAFVWLSLLATAYVFGKKNHMAMVFLREKWDKKSPKVKFSLALITELIVMAFAVIVLGVGGMQISLLAMGQISPAIGISMGYVYLALPISGLLTFLYNLLNLADLIYDFCHPQVDVVNEEVSE